MNKEKLATVIAAIENAIAANNGESFHMGYWAEKETCGTTACLAGWTVKVFNPELFAEKIKGNWDLKEYCIPREAAKQLELAPHEAVQLFFTTSAFYDAQYNEEETVLANLKELLAGERSFLSKEDTLEHITYTANCVYSLLLQESHKP